MGGFPYGTPGERHIESDSGLATYAGPLRNYSMNQETLDQLKALIDKMPATYKAANLRFIGTQQELVDAANALLNYCPVSLDAPPTSSGPVAQLSPLYLLGYLGTQQPTNFA